MYKENKYRANSLNDERWVLSLTRVAEIQKDCRGKIGNKNLRKHDKTVV